MITCGVVPVHICNKLSGNETKEWRQFDCGSREEAGGKAELLHIQIQTCRVQGVTGLLTAEKY